MSDRNRQTSFAVAQLVCTLGILVVVLASPKHHPSAGWVAASIALGVALVAIALAQLAPVARRVSRDGWSATLADRPPFRRSAAFPVLVMIVIAFIVTRAVS